MDILLTVLNFLLTVLFLVLGGLLLLAGRKYLWVLLGAGGLLISAGLIAEIVGQSNGWALVEQQRWIPLLISFAVGALGVFIALNYEHLATDLIGFAAGAFIASWFDEILLTLNNDPSDEVTWWTILIFIGAGILGVWLTRRDPDEALILISVIIGAHTIGAGLNLDDSRSITAVIILGLTLTGIVVQYASYLRDKPRLGQRLPPVPHPISEELPFE